MAGAGRALQAAGAPVGVVAAVSAALLQHCPPRLALLEVQAGLAGSAGLPALLWMLIGMNAVAAMVQAASTAKGAGRARSAALELGAALVRSLPSSQCLVRPVEKKAEEGRMDLEESLHEPAALCPGFLEWLRGFGQSLAPLPPDVTAYLLLASVTEVATVGEDGAAASLLVPVLSVLHSLGMDPLWAGVEARQAATDHAATDDTPDRDAMPLPPAAGLCVWAWQVGAQSGALPGAGVLSTAGQLQAGIPCAGALLAPPAGGVPPPFATTRRVILGLYRAMHGDVPLAQRRASHRGFLSRWPVEGGGSGLGLSGPIPDLTAPVQQEHGDAPEAALLQGLLRSMSTDPTEWGRQLAWVASRDLLMHFAPGARLWLLRLALQAGGQPDVLAMLWDGVRALVARDLAQPPCTATFASPALLPLFTDVVQRLALAPWKAGVDLATRAPVHVAMLNTLSLLVARARAGTEGPLAGNLRPPVPPQDGRPRAVPAPQVDPRDPTGVVAWAVHDKDFQLTYLKALKEEVAGAVTGVTGVGPLPGPATEGVAPPPPPVAPLAPGDSIQSAAVPEADRAKLGALLQLESALAALSSRLEGEG